MRKKTTNILLRVDPPTKKRLVLAARLSETTLTAFMLRAAEMAARRVERRHGKGA